MAQLIEKMLEADAIVLATPVYFYTMDAQLKTFIDRCVPRYTDMSGKEFYYIVTAADSDKSMLEKTVDAIRGFTLDCLGGTTEKGIIYAAGLWQKGQANGTDYVHQAYKMGKNA